MTSRQLIDVLIGSLTYSLVRPKDHLDQQGEFCEVDSLVSAEFLGTPWLFDESVWERVNGPLPRSFPQR